MVSINHTFLLWLNEGECHGRLTVSVAVLIGVVLTQRPGQFLTECTREDSKQVLNVCFSAALALTSLWARGRRNEHCFVLTSLWAGGVRNERCFVLTSLWAGGVRNERCFVFLCMSVPAPRALVAPSSLCTVCNSTRARKIPRG